MVSLTVSVDVIYFDIDPTNAHQVALSDGSTLGFMNNIDHTVTFQFDDFRYTADDQKYL